ncbi:restriction endonuclease subunit S [Streptomyces sp. NPDC127020]|uniref:restriction endonuclease subunit S n=1 Tax=Streptomyces sp. NPDC127020 TaxID=3347109 RepID=UPI00364F1C65
MIVEAKSGFACGEEDPDGIFQMRMNNVTRSGGLDLAKKRYVPASHKSVASTYLSPGDVLFNATNSPDLVGKSLVIPELGEPTVFSNHFLRLRTDVEQMLPSYLAHWLQEQFQRGVFKARCKQWVNQATVSRETLLGILLPVPSLAVQHEIVSVLDCVDALRTKRRETLALLEGLTQSVFRETFGDLLAEGAYPVKRLAEWVDAQRPITYGILKPGEHQPDGVPYVRVADMKAGGIDVSGVRRTTPEISRQYKRSSLQAGDILMSIRGHVGRFALVPESLKGANITQDSARLAVSVESARYVMEFLRTRSSQNWMAQRTKGAAVKGINLGDIKVMEIPEPPVELQKKFSGQADEIDRLVSLQRTHLSELDALFAALQYRAFNSEP